MNFGKENVLPSDLNEITDQWSRGDFERMAEFCRYTLMREVFPLTKEDLALHLSCATCQDSTPSYVYKSNNNENGTVICDGCGSFRGNWDWKRIREQAKEVINYSPTPSTYNPTDVSRAYNEEFRKFADRTDAQYNEAMRISAVSKSIDAIRTLNSYRVRFNVSFGKNNIVIFAVDSNEAFMIREPLREISYEYDGWRIEFQW